MIENVQAFEECSSTCTKCLDDKLAGADGKRHIVLCGGTGCLSSNSMEIKEKFEKLLEEKGLSDEAPRRRCGSCLPGIRGRNGAVPHR